MLVRWPVSGNGLLDRSGSIAVCCEQPAEQPRWKNESETHRIVPEGWSWFGVGPW